MNRVFCLALLLIITLLAQFYILPAFVPALLRPDVGLILGFLVLSFGSRDFGLVCLFCAGFEADLFSSERFGLLPLCYLLAAGVVLWFGWREMTRGDRLMAVLYTLVGTALAHLLYLALGRFCGATVGFGAGLLTVFSLLLAAAVWSYPLSYLCAQCLRLTRTLAPAVREKWAADARQAAARRGDFMRAG